MEVEESLNMTFDESPSPTKLLPLVDDDVGEEEAIRMNTKIVHINNEEDESIEVDEVVNIKESKNHPLDQVIGNLHQRTLRYQAQDHKEDDDMKVDIEEDENELELTYPYEEVDPLNPPPPASDSEPEDVIEVEDTIESEDETVPASVHEVGESSTAPFLREDSDGLFPGLMRRDINTLFVRSSVEQGTTAKEKLVEKLGNAREKAECKKLKKELEKARFSNTFLRMQNERVERDLYWTRVLAHEFYREMICGISYIITRGRFLDRASF
ncbi:hypothetical protein Tco_1311926 [Tanacetum coccineum]